MSPCDEAVLLPVRPWALLLCDAGCDERASLPSTVTTPSGGRTRTRCLTLTAEPHRHPSTGDSPPEPGLPIVIRVLRDEIGNGGWKDFRNCRSY